MDAPQRQSSSLRETGHRPWPLPRLPWVMGQTWQHLLFAHWRVDAELLAPYVPRGLQLQERDGSAWLGVTPFVVCALRPRGLRPWPHVSSFLEVNVRTYVTADDRPGILFLTLDASSRLAVAVARVLYRLPYHGAEMRLDEDGWLDYHSTRQGLTVHARYAPEGPGWQASDGSLEAFLIERYCLYTASAGVLLRADIHHRPWTLHAARAGSSADVALSFAPLDLEGEPLLHVAPLQDVVFWLAQPVRLAA
jgi:uncharacterized protein